MNEAFFLFQIISIVLFAWLASRFGREGLTTAGAILAVFANLFVLKQMNFLGFTVTCSDGFAVGSFLTLNLIREFHGQEAAKKAIKVSFLAMLFFALLSQIHLGFVPSVHDSTHGAYALLLRPAPRILIASLTAFFLMQRFEVWLFGRLSDRTKLPFALRNGMTLSLTQLFDTILFSFLGLYGIVANIEHVILISYTVKLLTIAILGPLTALIATRKPKTT